MAWVAVLILGSAGIFWWQRSQIVQLRAMVARQGDALESNQRRTEDLSLLLVGANRGRMDARASAMPPASARWLRRQDDDNAALRGDERRVILDQYRDAIAEMNLPAATASRLQDLLTDRIETVLDAEEAAIREGFAEGSSQTVRAVTVAVADLDREIVSLVGPNGSRLLDGYPSGTAPGPAVYPGPSAVPAIVTVVVQAPATPSYDASSAQPAASDGYPLYSPYLYSPYAYYPSANYFAGRAVARPLTGARTGVVRPVQPPSGRRGVRIAGRGRL